MSFQGDILPSEERRRSMQQPPPLRRLAVAGPSAPHPHLNHGYQMQHTWMGEIPLDQNTALGGMVDPFHRVGHFQYNQHEQAQPQYLTSTNGEMASGVRPTEFQQLSPSISPVYTRSDNIASGLQQWGPHASANRLPASQSASDLGMGMSGGGSLGIDGIGGVGGMGMGSEMNDVRGMIDTPAAMSSANWVSYDAAAPATHGRTLVTNPSVFTPVGLKCKWDGCEYQGDFTSTWTLERHVKTFHIDMSKYVCSSCGATKARLDKFKQHIYVDCPILRLRNVGSRGS